MKRAALLLMALLGLLLFRLLFPPAPAMRDLAAAILSADRDRVEALGRSLDTQG